MSPESYRAQSRNVRVVQLCEEGQVVDVGDKDRNVLLECAETLLNRVDAPGVAAAVAPGIVVAPLVVVAAVIALAARAGNVELGLLRLGVVGRAVLEKDVGIRRQAGDEPLSRSDPVGELLGLSKEKVGRGVSRTGAISLGEQGGGGGGGMDRPRRAPFHRRDVPCGPGSRQSFRAPFRARAQTEPRPCRPTRDGCPGHPPSAS